MSRPYFHTDAAPVAGMVGPMELELIADPLRPGELLVASTSGRMTIRVRLDEEKAVRLSAALYRWYTGHPRPEVVEAVHTQQGDTITQYRDGIVYSFPCDPSE